MAYEDSTTGARGTHHPAEPYQRPCLDLDGELAFHERVELVVRALRTCPAVAPERARLAELAREACLPGTGYTIRMFRAQAFPTLRCLITVAVDVRRRGKPATPPHDLLDCVFARGAWKGEL